MATYRKYEELGCTGPDYQYYNGKLQPVDEPIILGPETVPYRVESELEDDQK